MLLTVLLWEQRADHGFEYPSKQARSTLNPPTDQKNGNLIFFYWYGLDTSEFPWWERDPPFKTNYSTFHLYENNSVSKTLAVFLDFPYSAYETM